MSVSDQWLHAEKLPPLIPLLELQPANSPSSSSQPSSNTSPNTHRLERHCVPNWFRDQLGRHYPSTHEPPCLQPTQVDSLFPCTPPTWYTSHASALVHHTRCNDNKDARKYSPAAAEKAVTVGASMLGVPTSTRFRCSFSVNPSPSHSSTCHHQLSFTENIFASILNTSAYKTSTANFTLACFVIGVCARKYHKLHHMTPLTLPSASLGIFRVHLAIRAHSTQAHS
ncbi:hypothetical protein P692DRAFT_20875827 [Suillus brevipes Sb2]|nr:hypothetical protein P692DRAFT_20875827 [Suillus brevipes Sb2]